MSKSAMSFPLNLKMKKSGKLKNLLRILTENDGKSIGGRVKFKGPLKEAGQLTKWAKWQKWTQPKVHAQLAATSSHFRIADQADDCGFKQIFKDLNSDPPKRERTLRSWKDFNI